MLNSEKSMFPAPAQLHEHFAAIDSQNDRFSRADALDSSYRKLVKSDIADEQIESFTDLVVLAQPITYEEMGRRSLELAVEYSDAVSHLDTLTQDEQKKLNDANAQAALARELAPRKLQEIDVIAAANEEKIRQSNQQKVIIESLETQLNDYNTLFDMYGSAWPIPQSLNPEDRATLYDMIQQSPNQTQSGEMIIEDVMPLTPEERSRQASIAESAKRTIEAHDASKFIAYYLAENLNKIVTVEELVRFLYVAGEEEKRNHVTTLLGPKVQGRRIRKMLQDEYGLDLQYGMRKLLEDNGDKLVERRRTRIYRVVERGELNVSSQNEYNIEGNGSVIIDLLEAPYVDEESQPDTAELLVVDAPTDHIDAPEETLDETTWQEDLRNSTVYAIEKLIEANLFSDDEMRGTAIRSMSPSQMLGTETNRSRMMDAGIMTKTAARSDTMTREQRVIGLIFNKHVDVLSKKKSRAIQREALMIVQQVIASHLDQEG